MSLVCFLSFKIPTSFKYYLSNTFSFHKSNGCVICVLFQFVRFYTNHYIHIFIGVVAY